MRNYSLNPTEENAYKLLRENPIQRNEYVFQFVRLLTHMEDNCYSVALNGDWGSGKTFFVKQVKLILDAHNPQFRMEDETRREIRTLYKADEKPNSYKTMLGYKKGVDGNPEIIPEEAETVRRIFERYLAGKSIQNIRQALEASGVRNAAGTTEWTASNLRAILTNEKYCGDALLQKTFIKDCISKKAILNTGQLPKVLIQDNHEAIVSREMFDAVQLEIARRRAQDGRTRKSAPTGRGKFSGKYALSGLLFCAECGTAYRRVVWTQHGEKRAVWRCTSRLDYGKRYCLHSPTLDEGPLQQAILSAVNSAMSDHGTLTAQLIDTMEQELAPIPGESMSLGDIDRAMEGLGQQFNDLLREAADANNADSYTAQFQSISTAMAEFKRRKANILQIRQEQEQTNRRVQAVASVLKTASSELTEWDDNVIYQLLEKVTVLSREHIRVTLRDGLEIEQAVEQPKRRKFA